MPEVAKSSVRLARRDDSASLAPLMEAFSEAEGIAWRPELALAGFERLVSDRSLGFVLVAAVRGADPAGYTMITFSFDLEFGGRDAFVTELFVVPNVRRTGLAQALLAAAEVEAARNDVGALHLLVLPDNDRARSLYTKVGYVTSPRIMMTRVISRS